MISVPATGILCLARLADGAICRHTPEPKFGHMEKFLTLAVAQKLGWQKIS